jgi:hypothetical protein
MKVAVSLLALALATAAFAAAQNEMLSPMSTAVNALMEAAGVPNAQANRVVPIVTSGGATVGYAQIIGPQRGVDAVKAVVQIQAPGTGPWSVAALVPVTKVDRGTGTMTRAAGVGIDGLVNYKM